MAKKIKLLIFTKRVDGGTGSFVLSLQKLPQLFPNRILLEKVAVLEKPRYRQVNKKKFVFYRNSCFYPENFFFSISNIYQFLQDFFWLKNIINKINPDVVLGVDIHCNFILVILGKIFFRKIKIILTTHINLYDNIANKTRGLFNLLLKSIVPLYNCADCIVFVSKSLAFDCIKKFQLNKKKVKVIYNGIPQVTTYRQVENKKKENILITISRLVDQKDHLTLFKAFSIVQKKISHSQLWIIGDGNKRKKLKTYCQEFDIKKNVKFFGWVKDIYYYLNKSTLFVLSSKIEGFGYALIEAMSQGLPIISTNTPFGPREILDNGKYGILVPVGDERKMAKQIINLLTYKEKYNYYAQKALERSKYFSEEKMLIEYLSLFSKVVDLK
jgi:glycosyltransferase involved in cell wall biosynthesis